MAMAKAEKAELGWQRCVTVVSTYGSKRKLQRLNSAAAEIAVSTEVAIVAMTARLARGLTRNLVESDVR